MKIIYKLLFAMLLCTIVALNLSSCKDKDDGPKSSDNTEQVQDDKAIQALRDAAKDDTKTISSVSSNFSSYTVTFSDGTTVTVQTGEKGVLSMTEDETSYSFTLFDNSLVKIGKIKVEVTSISLSKTECSLVSGESFIIIASVLPENATDKALNFVCADGLKIGDADAEGGRTITAKYEGVFMIEVSSTNGIKEHCEVTVLPKITVVDLGLPSKLKWSTCNLGAAKPEDYGDYYAWGETATKTDYSWSTYLNAGMSSYKDCGTDKDPLKEYVYPNNKSIAGTQYDAATVNIGNGYRIPTYEEMVELRKKCSWTWTKVNGVKGYNVEGPNGNSIFLPAAGYRSGTGTYAVGSVGSYWSSNSYSSYAGNAYYLYFETGIIREDDARCYGSSVRFVQDN